MLGCFGLPSCDVPTSIRRSLDSLVFDSCGATPLGLRDLWRPRRVDWCDTQVPRALRHPSNCEFPTFCVALSFEGRLETFEGPTFLALRAELLLLWPKRVWKMIQHEHLHLLPWMLLGGKGPLRFEAFKKSKSSSTPASTHP